MTRARSASLLVAVLAIAGVQPARLHAQAATSGSTVTAEILLPPMAGTGIQNLVFGALLPGATADVPPGPATGGPTQAAGWRIQGVRKGRNLVWSLTTPSTLINGANTIAVNWNNSGYGTVCVSQPAGPCVLNWTFNPGAGSVVQIIPNSTPGNNFDVTIYAGAKITIPAVPSGTYTAPVTLTFAYLL